MKSVLDPIFIRRPRLNYISPPICEVLFSSSAFPIIILNPLNKKKGPTGLILGGRRGRITLRWNAYPGALCYNIYRADTVASLGPCSCSDQYTLIGDCVSFPGNDGFEINDFGCYVVTAILESEGETLFSDPICFNNGSACPFGTTFNPLTFSCDCNVQPCPPGQSWDPNLCICATCPVETCPPGFHWDAPSCSCVPDSTCSGIQFVDDLSNLATFNAAAPAFGGYKGIQNFTHPWVYFDRVSQSIDSIAPLHPGGTGSTFVAGSNKTFFGNEGPDYFFLRATVPSIVAVTLFALNPGESLSVIARMQADGSFFWPVDSGSGAHTNGYIYRPETNNWLNVGVTVPVQIGQSLWDMNGSRVVTGSIVPLVGNEKAVKITGGNTATDVPIPADAPVLANRATRGLRINEVGSVAGWWVNFAGSGNISPFVSIAGVGAFTIANGDTDNVSLISNTDIYITENNIVAGNLLELNTGATRGFIWTQTDGLTYLSASGINSFVSGVNSSGAVLGYTDNGVTPALWRNGAWTSLSALGMGALGWTNISIPISPDGNALTDDGFFFGGGDFNGDPNHGFAAKLCP